MNEPASFDGKEAVTAARKPLQARKQWGYSMAAAKVAVFVKHCNALPIGAMGSTLYTQHSASNAARSTNGQHHTLTKWLNC